MQQASNAFALATLLATLTATCASAAAPPRGPLNAVDLGAVGDGKADDTAALQAAIDQAKATSRALYIPHGTYRITKPIQIALRTYAWRPLRVTSDWATIQAAAEMDACVVCDISAWLTLERLRIDAAGLAQHGVKMFKISTARSLTQQVDVVNARSHGWVLEKCQIPRFVACTASHNAGDGWRIIDCNAATFAGCSAMANQANGFTVTRKDYSGGCVLRSTHAEKNKGHGIFIDGTASPVLVDGGWIEGNALDGVRVGAVDVVLRGLGVTGIGQNDNRAIRLLKGSSGCHVSACYVQRGGGAVEYAGIRLEAAPKHNVIEGNFNRYNGWRVEAEVVGGE